MLLEGDLRMWWMSRRHWVISAEKSAIRLTMGMGPGCVSHELSWVAGSWQGQSAWGAAGTLHLLACRLPYDLYFLTILQSAPTSRLAG